MADKVKQVFISHAVSDANFAHRLADDLKWLGARVWIAPESIRPGEEWVDAIERGLGESSHMVIVLTPAALQSRWVRKETNVAIALERQEGIHVIPLDVEECKVPLLLSSYQMISFRWGYDAGLKQLASILDLRVMATEPVRAPRQETALYYSCFISYSTNDEAFAQRLHNDLQGKGVRCWFAPEDIQGGRKLYDQIDQAIFLPWRKLRRRLGGRKLYDQIDQAIGIHDKLLLVLSEHSIHSEWVTTEIRRAREAEATDNRRKLFPIRLVDWETIRNWKCFDADTGKDLAVEVREYFVSDFSHWKDHDSYHQAFDRLLRDLKASEA
jgi:hypothetical protein